MASFATFLLISALGIATGGDSNQSAVVVADREAYRKPSESVGSLRLIGHVSIATGTHFGGLEFGGISGLDQSADGTYWAVSDNRGGKRGGPRFYSLKFTVDANDFKGVDILAMTHLRGPDGKLLPASHPTVDPEGIRSAVNGNLYISSEGSFARPPNAYQPFVREYKTDGTYVRDFEIPAIFQYVDSKTTGARSNKLFEALSLTPGGTLFVATEDSLLNDGPLTSLNAGSVVRVMRLDTQTGQSAQQYVYRLPPVPLDRPPEGRFPPDNGLPELLAITENEFIALERAYADGAGNTIRLVRTKIEPDTTNVAALDSLVGAAYKAMTRELLLEMSLLYEGVKLDNFEGLAWGPQLENGHRSLILVADNNFNEAQSTLFLAFEVLP